MLDKLSKIDIEFGRFGSPLYTGNGKLKTSPFRGVKGEDSLVYSKALEYIRKFNWKIKELQFKNDQLSVAFIINKIEFSTTLYPGRITNEFNYNISDFINNNRITAAVNIVLTKLDINTDLPAAEISGIKNLIRRCGSLKIDKELNSDDIKILNVLFENIEDSVYSSLTSITHILIGFISLITSVNLVSSELTAGSMTLNSIKVNTSL
jgi:hypothetical protein